MGLLARLLYRYLRGVDPAHLACPHPDRGPVPGEDDRVALDHAGDAPGEEEIPHLLQRRMFFCDHPVAGIVLDGVCILEQYAARYLLGREEGLDERAGDEHPDVGPGGEYLPRLLGEAGGDQYLREHFGYLGG